MAKSAQIANRSPQPAVLWIIAAGLALAAFALTLAWVSTGFRSLQGWASFLGVLLPAAGLLGGVWRLLRHEAPPRWLAGVLLLAVILRLALGAAWFVLLPAGGYQSPAELGGYVMADAAERDRAAWELGRSEKPLFSAFTSYRKADQYGGLLFFSALVYRIFGGGAHQPLLLVVLTASFSSLAILFVWALVRGLWGGRAAGVAAWGLALYPEAVLLGSSQLREAFLVAGITAAFYGLTLAVPGRSRSGPPWILGGLLVCLVFSPPVAGLLLALLAVQALAAGGRFSLRRGLRQRRFWLVLGLAALAAAAGIWLSWRQFAPAEVTNPFGLLSWWLQKSAEWQRHLTERASGWIQKIFDETPPWMHIPLLLIYGIVQPFLPAALIDITSVPVWYGIAVWRAIGWTALLPLLVYAPWRAFSRPDGDRFARGLSLVVWVVVLLASFRAGGDQWDNARYRAAFAGLQLALAAWAIRGASWKTDAGLRRILVGMGLVLAWFLPWYLRRYLHWPWPIESFYLTLGLGLLSALVYWAFDHLRMKT